MFPSRIIRTIPNFQLDYIKLENFRRLENMASSTVFHVSQSNLSYPQLSLEQGIHITLQYFIAD